MSLDTSRIGTFVIVIALLFVAVIIGFAITTNPTGGLAALVPFMTVALCLLAVTNPRAGLYSMIPLVIWIDQFKRLAVYFGGVNSNTVYQSLAMPFLVLGALNAGFFLHALFGKVKIDRIAIIFYFLAFTIGIGIFATMEATFASRAQRAANVAGYLTLVPIVYTYLKTFDEWRKFFALQVIIALPAAAWAINQYYYGFSAIEWYYARSGLSAVHSNQMFAFENPRTFGFFGSASALGCAAIYCAFAWWHGFRYREKRFLWIIAAMILTWVLVVSTQRSAFIYPFIVLICAFCFRRRITTLAFYATGCGLFVLGVIYSGYMLDQGLDNINRTIASENSWGEQVLKVSTFSDRLRGWERLNRADSYSLFGTGRQAASTVASINDPRSADYNHDAINKILISFGLVGIVCIVIPGVLLLKLLHNTVFRFNNAAEKKDAAFVLALFLPVLGLSMIGGDNFNTNPINLQIWTGLAGAFVCRNIVLQRRREALATANLPLPDSDGRMTLALQRTS